ncbi:MAG: hypothetical protein EHM61_05935 [Acidobacteria bacterium]|nr:MAG: hypothetical protein EHM61_05935 [Acidobacteriota bacterium]
MSIRNSVSFLTATGEDRCSDRPSSETADLRNQEEICLQRVLNSVTFSRSPRLARLLSYVCSKRFAGETADLKEYTIAVELLGRPVDFQTKEDASIRVDMNRLRRQLEKYYRGEGKRDEMVISIPSGQYVPLFERKPVPPLEPAEAKTGSGSFLLPVPPIRRPRLSWLFLAAGLCLGAIVTVVLQRAPIDFFTLANTQPDSSPGVSLPRPSPLPAGPEVRILSGARALQYVDKFGATWSGDTYFAGGLGLTYPDAYGSLPQDDGLWRNVREGDFEYKIPLSPGVYELHLYFIEMVYGTENEGGGEGSREFCVFANNKHILAMFDIVSDAGGSRIPDMKVFTDILPASDGFLHLRFESKKSKAVVSRVEILPGIPGKMRPVRIACRAASYTDAKGVTWSGDQFFQGGRIAVRAAEGNQDPGLYASERYGHFRYTVPVAPGRYSVRLHFFEGYKSISNADMWHSGPRLFDVFCNGEALLRDFSIEKAAGGPSRALTRTFQNVKANAQGKLILDFVPIKNYACLNALEVVPEG